MKDSLGKFLKRYLTARPPWWDREDPSVMLSTATMALMPARSQTLWQRHVCVMMAMYLSPFSRLGIDLQSSLATPLLWYFLLSESCSDRSRRVCRCGNRGQWSCLRAFIPIYRRMKFGHLFIKSWPSLNCCDRQWGVSPKGPQNPLMPTSTEQI